MEAINEKINRYRQIIKQILAERAAVPYLEQGIRDQVLCDEKQDRYIVISEGWQGTRRIHNVVIDLEIISGKVWVQADNTDVAVARELAEQGIPKSDIVLGFRRPEVRAETEYAAA